jgi:hypothetical protein
MTLDVRPQHKVYRDVLLLFGIVSLNRCWMHNLHKLVYLFAELMVITGYLLCSFELTSILNTESVQGGIASFFTARHAVKLSISITRWLKEKL